MTDVGHPLPWSEAWRVASREFWSQAEPGDHFQTSVGPALADRLAAIIHATDARQGHPESFTILDVGCGDGELIELLHERCTELAPRARWVGLDVRSFSRPGVESMTGTWPDIVGPHAMVGVVMAHEWLDEVPCDVVERDGAGVDRLVLVDRAGQESLGPAISDDEACAAVGVDGRATRAWIARWWPLSAEGERAEVGSNRDRAWAWLTSLLEHGTALATDYGHDLAERVATFPQGTLAAYRHGRVVRPVPDGRSGLTAHVALDACAAARPGTVVTSQRQHIPAPILAPRPSSVDVQDYFDSLRLRDRARLGDIGWLRWDC